MSAVRRDPYHANPANPGAIQVLYAVTWITDWLQIPANAQTVLRARALQGGWEVWLQVVLALNGPPAGLPGYTLEREQYGFLQDPKNRIDVILHRPAGSNQNTTPTFGIELKCRTATETSASFVNRVLKDMEKIKDSVATGLGLCRVYAVGITTDQNDLSGYAEVIDEDYKVYYWSVQDGAGGLFYLVWMGLQFTT